VYITVTGVNHPVLGIAKALSRVELQSDGSYNVTYVVTAENLGNDVLNDVQITDNLAETFPMPVTFTLVVAPYTNSTLTTNATFDGMADINLLDASASHLNVGATATVEFTINVVIWGSQQTFCNTAIGSAVGTLGTRVTDISDNGYITDENNNGDPSDKDESDCTPLTLTPIDVFIPDGFTPDGDGINDMFVIRGVEDYPNNKLSIYNRWGNLVYSQGGYKNDWNGKRKSGNLVPRGTYYYVFEYNKDDRKPVSGYLIIQY
jgi:gliding motility-associated-like protein/uncharacterized repeat protein (TIGR01451 family)